MYQLCMDKLALGHAVDHGGMHCQMANSPDLSQQLVHSIDVVT